MRTGLDFGETSHEQRLADIDQLMGWSHPGRKAQRVIAGTLFLSGSVWAVLLILSLFVLVGIVFNVIFVFGWLIYGGWFYVMIGKPNLARPMSVDSAGVTVAPETAQAELIIRLTKTDEEGFAAAVKKPAALMAYTKRSRPKKVAKFSPKMSRWQALRSKTISVFTTN